MPGPYEIVDPRPSAASAKYTFFLPSPASLDAIGKGDLVKVTIRAVPPRETWEAERMWIKVSSEGSDWLEGTLDSQPVDMPGVSQGDLIRFPRTHIIDVIFESADKESVFASKLERAFWERCWVDQAVLDGDLLVQYLYREEPSPMQEGDRYPDSGWRIRGDMRSVKVEDLGKRESAYVALGAVLREADPEVVETVKWRKPSNPSGVPVWEHGGIICTGETYKDKVKLTFDKGAALADPKRLFNSSLDGKQRRAIDIFEGDEIDAEALKALVKAAVKENVGE